MQTCTPPTASDISITPSNVMSPANWMVTPVNASMTVTTQARPPYDRAVLMGRPAAVPPDEHFGCGTTMSRGKLTADAHLWSAETCSSIVTSFKRAAVARTDADSALARAGVVADDKDVETAGVAPMSGGGATDSCGWMLTLGPMSACSW